jgi:uncharacterized protein (TIGR01777 family)
MSGQFKLSFSIFNFPLSIKMKVLVSGANGLIGSTIVKSLESDGHEILRLTRSAPRNSLEVQWQPEKNIFPPEERDKIIGIEAAIHLAGEPIMGRWSEEKKKKIYDSRVVSTKLLSETLAGLPQLPRVFVSASAVGYYGSQGDAVVTESSPSGNDFLADVCRDWEAAADAARNAGIRVAHSRFGIVLSKDGGALRKMLLPFKLGLGGPLGSGGQYMSWITLPDTVKALRFALEDNTMTGAVNFVAPEPVTSRAFAHALGRALHRPAALPLPAFALRLALGTQSANETVLANVHAIPEKLTSHGFEFEHPWLDKALRQLLA